MNVHRPPAEGLQNTNRQYVSKVEGQRPNLTLCSLEEPFRCIQLPGLTRDAPQLGRGAELFAHPLSFRCG